MSQMGQTEKNSVRAYVFRFALKLGHRSTHSTFLKRATNGHPARFPIARKRGHMASGDTWRFGARVSACTGENAREGTRWKDRVRDRCACRKSNPDILVVQPAKNWAAKNVPGPLDGARDRRILLQG